MCVVDSGGFHHLCFVVRDIDAAAQRLSESLSIGPWGVWTIEPTESSVHGEPRDCTFRVALAEAGGVNYELLSCLCPGTRSTRSICVNMEMATITPASCTPLSMRCGRPSRSYWTRGGSCSKEGALVKQ